MGLNESKLQEPNSWINEVRRTTDEELVAFKIDTLDVIVLHSSRSNYQYFLVHPHSTLAFFYYDVTKMVRQREHAAQYFNNIQLTMLQNPSVGILENRPDSGVPFLHASTNFVRTGARAMLRDKRDWVAMDFDFLFWGMYNADVVMGLNAWLSMMRNHTSRRPLEKFAEEWLRGNTRDITEEPEDDDVAKQAIAKMVRSTEIQCVRTLQRFLEQPKRDMRNVIAIASAAEILLNNRDEDAAEEKIVLDTEEPEEKEDDKGAEEEPPADDEEEDEEEKEEEESADTTPEPEEEEYVSIRVRVKDLRALQAAIFEGEIK